MSRKVAVTRGGLLTTIQDKGRIGYQEFGMPTAGVMDKYAMNIANLLVGNDLNEGVLEITYSGFSLTFEDDCLIAITGADLGAVVNGENLAPWASYHLSSGDELTFSKINEGIRAYIAFQGGMDVPKVLGSKSTYLRGAIGGFSGRSLKEGDVIPLSDVKESLKTFKVPEEYIPIYNNEIKIILGPQADYFLEAEISKFLNTPYKISAQCDRMGYRLEGEKLNHKNGADIISDGINFGAIQVPGEGHPIIMMADHQTTGGYAKIANVITVDLPNLAQLGPGKEINFKEVSVSDAQKMYIEKVNMLESLKDVFNEYQNYTQKFRVRLNGQEYIVEVEKI